MAMFHTRHFSQLVKNHGKGIFLVDTVRRLEGEGIPSKHAGAITGAITEVLNDSRENVSGSLVCKGEMQKTEMLLEAKFSKFTVEMLSLQEHHFSLLQHEIEKLSNDMKKMGSELRHDIHKIRHEIDKFHHSFKEQLEATKYDILKYNIGSAVSIFAVGLAVLRIWK